MAHVQKVKQGAVAPLVAHYERTPELERGYVRGNIDPDRIGLNYNLRPSDVRQEVGLAIAQHEQTAGKAIRKDANVLLDWVVTMPGDCPPDMHREFFESVARFMEGRYGEGNVLGCYVHMDEATPHAHIPILPMRDGKLVSAKVVNRQDLKTFHGDLGKAVDEALGMHVSIELDESQHLEKALNNSESQKQFKLAKDAARAQLVNEVADLEGDIVELDSAIEDRRIELSDLGEQVERSTERLECLQGEIGDLEAEIAELEAGGLEPAREAVSESVRALWKGRGAGSREDALAGEVEGLRERISGLERSNQRARERVGELDRELPGLRARHRGLEERFAAVERRVTEVIGRMREVPNVVSEWAQGIARRLGRPVFDPRSLSHMSREATRAARAQEASRSAHLPSRDIRGDIGAR